MVEISEGPDELVIRVDDFEAARYRFGGGIYKPYLSPLNAANGMSLLSNEPVDHGNHHGISFGYGRVSGQDFWLERHNSGRILHRQFSKISNGKTRGVFVEECAWEAADGAPVLEDTRSFTFHSGAPEQIVLDIEITLRAPSDRAVRLDPTIEGGFPHIRPAAPLGPHGGGLYTNAEGAKNEAGLRNKRSAWVDASGTLGQLECGIALMDHPENAHHPALWLVRDYGSIGIMPSDEATTTVKIEPGGSLVYRYRVVAHSGDATKAGIADLWAAYSGNTAAAPKTGRLVLE